MDATGSFESRKILNANRDEEKRLRYCYLTLSYRAESGSITSPVLRQAHK
jgi:hypothetical protein